MPIITALYILYIILIISTIIFLYIIYTSVDSSINQKLGCPPSCKHMCTRRKKKEKPALRMYNGLINVRFASKEIGYSSATNIFRALKTPINKNIKIVKYRRSKYIKPEDFITVLGNLNFLKGSRHDRNILWNSTDSKFDII